MKLNINPKELLALYNVLYERFESSAGGTVYAEGSERASTDTNLHELYKRVKACLIASLSNKMVDPLDSWLKGQERKIGELNTQNDQVKQDAKQLIVEGAEVFPNILSAEDTDTPESYPRRAPRPSMPSQRKFHGNRR